MNYDLKIIKKKYGEKFSQLCRELFSTLLETEGLLSKLLLDNFDESHYLYQDIVDNHLEDSFKDYIYSKVNVENNNIIDATKTPSELMDEVGYILYECKTEEDIQKFKKYYASGEELCTFNGGRLNRCHVYFAVKKNVDEIRRADFANPSRQDEYGTSVISIQFTKDKSYTLSIKNRYNHTVNNPDATFSNNLDNIIPGLTDSFANHYGMVQSNPNSNFEIPGYIRASDGKYYKFNYEINNIYYCSNNVIIDNFEVKKYDKSRYLIIDYFIIDLVNKKILIYDDGNYDSFIKCIEDIDRINIINIDGGKKIEFIGKDNKKLEIYIDTFGRIIRLKGENIEKIGNDFMAKNNILTEFSFPNLRTIGKRFMMENESLAELNLPSLVSVDYNFLHFNTSLKKANFPSLRKVKDGFLYGNVSLIELNAPNLEKVGICCLYYNKRLTKLSLPSLRRVDSSFLHENKLLTELNAPNLQEMGTSCLYNNQKLTKLNLPSLRRVGSDFLPTNRELREFIAPNLELVGDYFLYSNNSIINLNLSSLVNIGYGFLSSHEEREVILYQIKESNKNRKNK